MDPATPEETGIMDRWMDEWKDGMLNYCEQEEPHWFCNFGTLKWCSTHKFWIHKLCAQFHQFYADRKNFSRTGTKNCERDAAESPVWTQWIVEISGPTSHLTTASGLAVFTVLWPNIVDIVPVKVGMTVSRRDCWLQPESANWQKWTKESFNIHPFLIPASSCTQGREAVQELLPSRLKSEDSVMWTSPCPVYHRVV